MKTSSSKLFLSILCYYARTRISISSYQKKKKKKKESQSLKGPPSSLNWCAIATWSFGKLRQLHSICWLYPYVH